MDLSGLISKKYRLQSDEEIEHAIAKEAETYAKEKAKEEADVLTSITDVRGPDGMKVVHAGSGFKANPEDLKKRYCADARKNFKEFSRVQKRSKIM